MFAVGAAVEAVWVDEYGEGGDWYEGVVEKEQYGRYVIHFQDGDKRTGVPEAEVRPIGGAEAPPAYAAPTTRETEEEVRRASSILDDGMGDLLEGILGDDDSGDDSDCDAPPRPAAAEDADSDCDAPPRPAAGEDADAMRLTQLLDDGMGDLLDGILDDDDDEAPAAAVPFWQPQGTQGARDEYDDDDGFEDDDDAAAPAPAEPRVPPATFLDHALFEDALFVGEAQPPCLPPDDRSTRASPRPAAASPRPAAASRGSRGSRDDEERPFFALTAVGGARNISSAWPAVESLAGSGSAGSAVSQSARGSRVSVEARPRAQSAVPRRRRVPQRQASYGGANWRDAPPLWPRFAAKNWEGVRRWLDAECLRQALEPKVEARRAEPPARETRRDSGFMRVPFPPRNDKAPRNEKALRRSRSGASRGRDLESLERGFDLRL
ncbi:hypothetical protein M885DRAFT_525715 [Pelagophyceae sp. CCMP2097]|nr:hypothetical protein M885DRAFT_525715 [Pelagophyceae sp. CCMP2097]